MFNFLSCSLDYPGIGPEHSHLKDWGRAEYYAATDKEALDAFQLLSKLEGIIPALETSHALAHLEVSVSTSVCQHSKMRSLAKLSLHRHFPGYSVLRVRDHAYLKT